MSFDGSTFIKEAELINQKLKKTIMDGESTNYEKSVILDALLD